MITTRFKQSSHHIRPIPSHPSSRLQQDSSRISPYNMTQADAYNCAFRSHHLIRFRGCWGSVYMGGRVLEPSFTWGNASWTPRGLPRRSPEASKSSKRPPRAFKMSPEGFQTVIQRALGPEGPQSELRNTCLHHDSSRDLSIQNDASRCLQRCFPVSPLDQVYGVRALCLQGG